MEKGIEKELYVTSGTPFGWSGREGRVDVGEKKEKESEEG